MIPFRHDGLSAKSTLGPAEQAFAVCQAALLQLPTHLVPRVLEALLLWAGCGCRPDDRLIEYLESEEGQREIATLSGQGGAS